jgi:predicted nucleic acid-binding protein
VVERPSRHIYWDTSCFICFLNRSELERRAICEDILRNAQNGFVTLYTSTLTIAETLYPRRTRLPNPRRLTPNEANLITGMFRWSWLRKVDVDQRIAFYAADLARDYNLYPNDAIHGATTILMPNIDTLQRWDRDFSRVNHLINVEDPARLSIQGGFDDILERIGPHPDDILC